MDFLSLHPNFERVKSTSESVPIWCSFRSRLSLFCEKSQSFTELGKIAPSAHSHSKSTTMGKIKNANEEENR